MVDDAMFGFIVVRHMRCQTSQSLWRRCYESIRANYGKNVPIVIIDDNSVSSYFQPELERDTVLCRFISAEKHLRNRGEMLGYYYLHKHRFFKSAVIMHDSAFFQSRVEFTGISTVRFLWHFGHPWDNPVRIRKLLNDYPILLDWYNDRKNQWVGCFGMQSFIQLEFLENIYGMIHPFFEILRDREDRKAFERIFAIICHVHDSRLIRQPSFFGCIVRQYKPGFGYTLQQYLKRPPGPFIPLIKIWVGR